ncbi:MAG TPA: hypothetical protein PKN33_16345 [Phycisphaerae bacterium]|nr:hypothetical protein [Phycisphaerae bacterium]
MMRKNGMRLFGAMTAFVSAFGLASGVMACDKEIQTVEAVAAHAGSTDMVEAGVARVMDQLPQMTYKVGDMETRCGYTAASKAKETGSSVSYLVAGSTYNCKVTAMNKLAEAMEAELASTASVAPSVAGSCYHCPMAAAAMAKQKNTQVKYMVAGIEFDSEQEAQAVAEKLAARMHDFGAMTASAKAPCSKSAGSTAPCTKSAQVASATAKSKGCCKDGCAKAAAGGAPCDKSAEAATASAKGGCTKSKEAQTASAEGGCTKSKEAQTASAKGGCCKDKAKAAAVVAAAEPKEPTTITLDCCKKKTGTEAKTETVTQVASTDVEASEDTPELARAKQMVREIVEFVAAAKNS